MRKYWHSKVPVLSSMIYGTAMDPSVYECHYSENNENKALLLGKKSLIELALPLDIGCIDKVSLCVLSIHGNENSCRRN